MAQIPFPRDARRRGGSAWGQSHVLRQELTFFSRRLGSGQPRRPGSHTRPPQLRPATPAEKSSRHPSPAGPQPRETSVCPHQGKGSGGATGNCVSRDLSVGTSGVATLGSGAQTRLPATLVGGAQSVWRLQRNRGDPHPRRCPQRRPHVCVPPQALSERQGVQAQVGEHRAPEGPTLPAGACERHWAGVG